MLAAHSDEGKLAQVLRNFISNALKFTERGSVTDQRSSPARQQSGTPNAVITFSVADTGVGIAPEHHRPRHAGVGAGRAGHSARQVKQERQRPRSPPLPDPSPSSSAAPSTSPPPSDSRHHLPRHHSWPSYPPRGLATSSHGRLRNAPIQPPNPRPEIMAAHGDEVERYLLRRQHSPPSHYRHPSLRPPPARTPYSKPITAGDTEDRTARSLFLDLVLPGAFPVSRSSASLRQPLPPPRDLPIVRPHRPRASARRSVRSSNPIDVTPSSPAVVTSAEP